MILGAGAQSSVACKEAAEYVIQNAGDRAEELATHFDTPPLPLFDPLYSPLNDSAYHRLFATLLFFFGGGERNTSPHRQHSIHWTRVFVTGPCLRQHNN